SGFMRLRNEEEYVEAVIESVIDSLDELVVVHNACTDRTPEIVESCRARYPERIHVYKYEPLVYRYASKEHRSLPMDSPHSLVNYHNYALAKTTRRIAVKIDGDDLFIPERLRQAVDNIRAGGLSKPLGFQGINLWDEDGEIWVNAQHPVMTGMDRGFFSVCGRTFFVHHSIYELFTYAFERSLGILFFHLKGMKRDRGVGNYEMQAEKTSLPRKKILTLTSPDLISWSDFKRMMPEPTGVPEPSALGLRPKKR
ncbi:MAG: glycosyltransferase family 2 protein, partial [Gammaproteobacteria bacterium]|nr:glycosyltransferase family 2 protein [Gammaproteobacteria bacterium]